MEDKENSGGSANTSSSDELVNNRGNIKDTIEKASAEPTAEEVNTEDLNLQLELDESGSLKETQDEYRMFSRIGSSSVNKRNGSQSCDKDAQEFQLSKSTDEGEFSPSIQESDNSNTNKYPNKKHDVTTDTKLHEESRSKGRMKRLLDSQGK